MAIDRATKTKEVPATLTVGEAGELLGISRRSAYRAVERGQLPALRLGRRLVVPSVRLLEFLHGDARPASAQEAHDVAEALG
jgi:excisionase family DNA binding protein